MRSSFFCFISSLFFLTQGFAQDRNVSFSRACSSPPKHRYYSSASSDGQNCSSSSKAKKVQPMLAVKAGYFFFSNPKMRKIYDRGGLDLQLCMSYPIQKWLQIYSSFEYMERHGNSLNGGEKTRIWEIPLSLGMKPVFVINSKVQYYFTLGPRYFFMHQHNTSIYVDKKVVDNNIGGFVNTGFQFILHRHLLIDFFGEYSFVWLRAHHSKAYVYKKTMQAGGFTFGASLGHAF